MAIVKDALKLEEKVVAGKGDDLHLIAKEPRVLHDNFKDVFVNDLVSASLPTRNLDQLRM